MMSKTLVPSLLCLLLSLLACSSSGTSGGEESSGVGGTHGAAAAAGASASVGGTTGAGAGGSTSGGGGISATLGGEGGVGGRVGVGGGVGVGGIPLGNGGAVGVGGKSIAGGAAGSGAMLAAGGAGPGAGGEVSGGGFGYGGEEPGNGGMMAAGGVVAAGGATASEGGRASGGNSATEGGTTSGKGLTVYYVRHGQVRGNLEGIGGLSYEEMDELTELGLRQVDAVTTYLTEADWRPDVILTSPTGRTQNTIAPYLAATSATAEMWPELAECCSASPTGAALPTEPVFYDFLTISLVSPNIVLRDDGADKMWRTDTYEQGLFMVNTARDKLLGRYSQSGLTVLISGHAVAGSILFGLLRGYPMTTGQDEVPGLFYMLNTGVQKLVQDPETGEFTLDGMNINKPITE